jgi:ribosome-binding protein aMBF1 (putative translation factor)
LSSSGGGYFCNDLSRLFSRFCRVGATQRRQRFATLWLELNVFNNSPKPAARANRIKRALAEAIRNARKRRGLSQAALSKRARTTQAVVSRIENLNTSYLSSVEVLARLAGALGAHLEIAFVPEAQTSSQKRGVRQSL